MCNLNKIVVSIFRSRSRSKMHISFLFKLKRFCYLMKNGGPKAVYSGFKRYRAFRRSAGMLPTPIISDILVAATAGRDAEHNFHLSAKMHEAELLIIASRGIEYQSGLHRSAQLALAAANAGYHVSYAEIDEPASHAIFLPGLAKINLKDRNPPSVFRNLSEHSVVLVATADLRALEYVKFAKARGVGTYFDLASIDNRARAHDGETVDRLVETVDWILLDRDETTSSISKHTDKCKIIGNAASHVYFDPYVKHYPVEEYKSVEKGRIGVIYLPAGDELIDWGYVADLAAADPRLRIFVLGLLEERAGLPASVTWLGEDKLNYVNAFISGADFMLAPIRQEVEYLGYAATGLMAAHFLRKPILTSHPIAQLTVPAATLMRVPRVIGNDDLLQPTADDQFVSQNSWIGKLEQIAPFRAHAETSVVILIHNNASIIERCIATLLAHCASFIKEVIVVDNASTDGGAELVEKRFPTVKLIRNPLNGCSSGRNLGVQNSSGKYIAFFDSDQWFVGGGCFDEALTILRSNASVGMVGWNAGWFDASRTDLGGAIADYCPNRAMNAEAIRRGYRTDIGFLGTSGLWMRRETFDAIEGFDTFYDPTCFEDTDICFQVRALGLEIAYRDLTGIRHQPHQTTGAHGGNNKYQALFHRNAAYFKDKWSDHPEFFVDYTA